MERPNDPLFRRLRPKPSRARKARPGEPFWAHYADDDLLGLRMSDLDVRLEGTELQENIDRLHGELDERGFRFRPHFWLSHGWFSPDGTGGIAIPFYLAHPRLRALEKKQMLEVEGGSDASCMRILRHELGHALDNVYRLHYRKRYRELFGSWSVRYPEFYRPRPYSKGFVQHLDMWYAQSHPAEDFAETFAVWLRPNSRWRQRYAGWGALKKLEYVDELMAEIAPNKPPPLSRKHYFALRKLRKTLREFYAEKREHYGRKGPSFYDQNLRKLFSDDAKYRRNPTAASFLRGIRPELREMVSRWTAEYQYTIDQVLADIIKRCREMNLRLVRSPGKTKIDTMVMITVQTMNYLSAGNHRVAM